MAHNRDALGASGGVSSLISAHRLERLAWKYRALVELRRRREDAVREGLQSFGPDEAAARKREFRRIARSFPGALRELDSLSAEVLERRAREVDEALERLCHGEAGCPDGSWIALAIDFHESVRECLATKRWLSARVPRGGGVSDDVVDAFLRRRERLCRLSTALEARSTQGPPPAGQSPATGLTGSSIDRAEVSAVLTEHWRPPGGRLLALVWTALEMRHGRPRADLEASLFGCADSAVPSLR
ncbi:hypothetical protein [Vulgatibacter incomptus]|uniref:Uncharacterized protein n=1 Tax=Vulgatibacter incomptus TaxID=1391653 RepID=A0A0K1PBX6_9BACT|nr:hypothetical protein [Vulgatibacter incomptus]AKU91002.1 hypothetical protein AKJ08_1389 [Vulgatibacter incomptus]